MVLVLLVRVLHLKTLGPGPAWEAESMVMAREEQQMVSEQERDRLRAGSK